LLEALLFIMTPIIAIWINRRESTSWLDPVWICYGAGVLAALSPWEVSAAVAETTTEICIPLAIPMLLFRTNIKSWLAQSRKVIIAMVVAVLSVLVSAMITGAVFAGAFEGVGYVLAMMTATLIGGSPNLVSVGKALDAPEQLLLLTNASDIITGAFYLLFLLTIAQSAVGKLLKPTTDATPMIDPRDEALGARLFAKEAGISVGVSVLIAGVSAGIAFGITGKLALPVVLLGLTTGGILASTAKPLREMRANMEVGNYLILVFCVAVGSLTDLDALFSDGSAVLQVAAMLLGIAVVLHYSVCKLLSIDADTAIIASTASIMGPPLVVPVARKLDNQQAFVSGLTSGLIGYALGNYLGLAVGYAFGVM